MMRIGQGFDVHAFTRGDSIRVGGVDIAHDRAIAAHSDGDVALHALCDALLGALALGDIGQHFPDSDPRWKDADSGELLTQVHAMINARGWALANLDITLMAERPRFAPHLPAMRRKLSELLGVTLDQVSIKATTTEQLGFIGRGEGIAALAMVLLTRRPD